MAQWYRLLGPLWGGIETLPGKCHPGPGYECKLSDFLYLPKCLPVPPLPTDNAHVSNICQELSQCSFHAISTNPLNVLTVGSLPPLPSFHPVPLVLTQYLPRASQYFQVLTWCLQLLSSIPLCLLSIFEYLLRPPSYYLVRISCHTSSLGLLPLKIP